MITLKIRPEFEDSYTEIILNGSHEDAIANTVISDWLQAAADVLAQDEDGDWIDVTELYAQET